MAIRLVVTRGYGNGTFDGTIADVVRRGYGAAEASAENTGAYARGARMRHRRIRRRHRR